MLTTAARLPQEIDQQPDDRVRLFLLHPMPGAVEQVYADHAGAGALLHPLDRPRPLVAAPIAVARDEDRRHVDGAAGEPRQLALIGAAAARALPVQAALAAPPPVLA